MNFPNDEELFWSRISLFSTFDQGTFLNIYLGGGISIDPQQNFIRNITSKLTIEFNRNSNHSNKSKFDIQINDAYEFEKKFSEKIKLGKKAYEDSHSFQIKKTDRTGKILTIGFKNEGQYIAYVGIKDPSSVDSTMFTRITPYESTIIYKIVQQYLENYTSINTTNISNALQELQIKRLNTLIKKFEDTQLSKEEHNSNQFPKFNIYQQNSEDEDDEDPPPNIDPPDDNNLDDDPIDFSSDALDNVPDDFEGETPDEEFNLDEEFKELNEAIESADPEIDIENENKNKPIRKEPQKISNDQFLSTFLSYDVTKIEQWISTIISVGENSNVLTFSPMDFIMELCHISKDEQEILQKQDHYYQIQYLNTMISKWLAKYNIEKTGYPKFLPVTFKSAIKPENKQLWNLALNCAVTTITIAYMYEILNKFSKVLSAKNTLEKYDKIRTYCKLHLMPFFLSAIDKNTYEQFISDIDYNFKRFEEFNLFNKINEEYKDICGNNMFWNINEFKKFSIPQLEKGINFQQDIKVYYKNYFKNHIKLPADIKQVDSQSKVREKVIEIINEAPDENLDSNIEDEQFRIYLRCLLREKVDIEFIKKLKAECQNYDDVSEFFRLHLIPDDAVYIKRALDNCYPIYSDMSSILKEVKEVKKYETANDLMTRVTNTEISKEFNLKVIENNKIRYKKYLNNKNGNPLQWVSDNDKQIFVSLLGPKRARKVVENEFKSNF